MAPIIAKKWIKPNFSRGIVFVNWKNTVKYTSNNTGD
jgi:hypothetical protein